MNARKLLLTVFLIVCMATTAFGRKWTDATGKFSVEADFVEVKESNVLLKKADGEIISVPIGKLCAADRDFIDAESKAKEPSEATKVEPRRVASKLRGKTAIEWGKQLKSKDSDLRIEAADALVEMGKDAEPAVNALVGALRDSDEELHETAADTLVKIGKEAVPTLLTLLKGKDDEVRVRAIQTLGKIGTDAKSALPALTARLKDESVIVREQAADAIDKINDTASSRTIGSRIGDYAGTWSGKAETDFNNRFPNAKMSMVLDAKGEGYIDSRPGGDSNIDYNQRFDLTIKSVKNGKVTLPGDWELRLNKDGTTLTVRSGRGADQLIYQLKKE